MVSVYSILGKIGLKYSVLDARQSLILGSALVEMEAGLMKIEVGLMTVISVSIALFQWRRPGAEFGGTKKIFADQDNIFSLTFFSGKISIFTANISDDLFLSHRPGFSDFPFLSPDFSYLYYVKCRISPFPHKKKPFFTLFILSRASDNNASQNIG